MSNILVSTIVRNREATIPSWHSQIKDLVTQDPDNNYYLSVYENDSEDKSIELIKSLDYSFFKDHVILTEKLHTEYFASVQSFQRVDNLAKARNQSIYKSGFLNKCDYVLSVEPDSEYIAMEALEHVISQKNYDVISGMSVCHNLEWPPLYDSWATRKTKHDESWDFSIALEGLIPVWSTFNCFCMYNAEPFKNNITFSGFNKRLDRPDCDTTVVCERFRSNGYNKIYMNCNFKIIHFMN